METVQNACFYCLDKTSEMFSCVGACLEKSNIHPAYPGGILVASLLFAFVFFILGFYFKNDMKKFAGSRLLSIAFFSVAVFTIGLVFNGHLILQQLPLLIPAVGIASYSVSYFLLFYLIKRNYRPVQLHNKAFESYTRKVSKRLKVSMPGLYMVFSKEPKAFLVDGFKKAVFLSDSLIERLSESEIKAVILHELYHLRRRSGLMKNVLNSIRNLNFRIIPLPLNELEKREEVEIDKIMLKSHNIDINKIRQKLWGLKF